MRPVEGAPSWYRRASRGASVARHYGARMQPNTPIRSLGCFVPIAYTHALNRESSGVPARANIVQHETTKQSVNGRGRVWGMSATKTDQDSRADQPTEVAPGFALSDETPRFSTSAPVSGQLAHDLDSSHTPGWPRTRWLRTSPSVPYRPSSCASVRRVPPEPPLRNSDTRFPDGPWPTRGKGKEAPPHPIRMPPSDLLETLSPRSWPESLRPAVHSPQTNPPLRLRQRKRRSTSARGTGCGCYWSGVGRRIVVFPVAPSCRSQGLPTASHFGGCRCPSLGPDPSRRALRYSVRRLGERR